jgi:hypothetical protein
MRDSKFIDAPQRELLWATIQYRDELVFVMTALEWIASEVHHDAQA